ncbi:MAG: hypothetical protein AAF438_19070, partial [Pseudomonadota bacterium]
LGDDVADPLTAEDGQVNGRVYAPVLCWSNIGYLDNNWHETVGSIHEDIFDLNGLSTIGDCMSSANSGGAGNNIDLSQEGMSHGGVYAWYYGTIPFALPDSNEVEIDTSWYGSESPLRQSRDGYNRSRAAGVTSPDNLIEPDANFVSPLFDETLYDWSTGFPTIFNGDFSLGAVSFESWLELGVEITAVNFLPVINNKAGIVNTLALDVIAVGSFFDRPIWIKNLAGCGVELTAYATLDTVVHQNC